MKQHKGMRPQDIAVLLKMAIMPEGWLNKDLAAALRISPAEITDSLNRSRIAKLTDPAKKKVMRTALLELIQHGLPYVFPAEIGPVVKGIPTAHSAPVMDNYVLSVEKYVWPAKDGSIRGHRVSPLYPNAVVAAKEDKELYDMLALVDVVRIGKVREKEQAIKLIKQKLTASHA